MNKPKKECGSCIWFTKWKSTSNPFGPSFRNHSGLCEKLDAVRTSDRGRKCSHWKGKKYERHAKYPLDHEL